MYLKPPLACIQVTELDRMELLIHSNIDPLLLADVSD